MTTELKYHHEDHAHCWEEKTPPCGQKIEHLKCCLCELPNPKITEMNTPTPPPCQSEEQEKTIEDRIDEIIDALVADVTYEKTWPAHTAYYQLDLNAFQEKLRQALHPQLPKGDEELGEEDLTPFETKLAQAILAALEYRGFYDCGKYLDASFIEKLRPLLNTQQETAVAEALRNVPVGFVRQWINEDLLKDGVPMVTNEDIQRFINIALTKPTDHETE